MPKAILVGHSYIARVTEEAFYNKPFNYIVRWISFADTDRHRQGTVAHDRLRSWTPCRVCGGYVRRGICSEPLVVVRWATRTLQERSNWFIDNDITRASKYDHEFCEANLRPFTEPVGRWGHDRVRWWFGMETIHAKETHKLGGSNVGVCATLTLATVWRSMCTVGGTGSRVWTLTLATRWWWVWCGITCAGIITSMQTTILPQFIWQMPYPKLPLTWVAQYAIICHDNVWFDLYS